jgi:hypothetical protein
VEKCGEIRLGNAGMAQYDVVRSCMTRMGTAGVEGTVKERRSSFVVR